MSSQDRDRQKRLQRKRNKKAAKRGTRHGAGERGMPSLGEMATTACIEACAILLGGRDGIDKSIRAYLHDYALRAGGLWPRLLLELEQFMFDKIPWGLTCADLAPLRRAFEQCGADQAFSRLWALALTNASEEAAFARLSDEDCPQRAAAAFEELWGCLADPSRSPAVALQALAQEIICHDAPKGLASAYAKLLIAALASLQAPTTSRERVVVDLARDVQDLFARHVGAQSSSAWWHCGRLFFAEVFERHAQDGYATPIATHPDLIRQLFDAPEAAIWIATVSGVRESLRALHIHSTAGAWLKFLDSQIDRQALPFEDRVRFEISRLKLLVARQKSGGRPATKHPDFLPAFEELRKLLAHGVPPTARDLPGLLEAPLVNFYLDGVQALHCEAPAFSTTVALLKHHPEDFRLACLLATGAVLCGEHHKLQVLANHIPRAHIDPDLLARSALSWTELPHGLKAMAAIRPLLFDALDREHRKQCLLTMSRQLLSRATSVRQYHDELRRLLPFFERDSFVYRELGENHAMESALVFLATLMAPFHELKLALTEAQSRQWVSHGREIAKRSAVGAELVTQYLNRRSPSFVLEHGVRSAALAQTADFRPSAQPQPSAPQSRASARRARRPASHSGQRGLFDDHNP